MSEKYAATRNAYLSRLGLESEPPSAKALFRLHRAQVERVSYETLWIHLDERWGIGAVDSFERIARGQRGGYCFHLNGAFGELLTSLDYDVTRHVGGVHGSAGPSNEEMTNHLVLTVHGLPTDRNRTGSWYVDVGLGDALFEPLPLVSGTYQQGPFRLVLDTTPDGVGDWHLGHDPSGSFAGMAWRTAPAADHEFVARHAWLSTSPDSGFVKFLTMQRRDADGVDVLRGLTLQRVGKSPTSATVATRADLVDVLHDVFGVDVDLIGRARLDVLWEDVYASHVAWEAAGCP